MQFRSVLVALMAPQALAVSLNAAPAAAEAAAPAAAGPAAAAAPKGVGDVQDFAHLLPFHPRGQQELLMKTRCVNFLNNLLEKSAYAPDAVGPLMPKCKWSEAECKFIKDDLMKRLSKGAGPAGAPGPAPAAAAPAPAAAGAALVQQFSELFQPWPERGGPKDHAVTWINGPRGPQPNFATAGGMDESIYGWCDTMYDVMKKKAISELDEEQKKAKEDKEEAKDEEKDDSALLQQDPCAGCTEGLSQAYQSCAMKHGNPCAETNSAGLVSSGPGTKKDIGCCMKKEKHDRCLKCSGMDCAHGTCNVNKKYYNQRTIGEKPLDDKKAMKKAGWGK